MSLDQRVAEATEELLETTRPDVPSWLADLRRTRRRRSLARTGVVAAVLALVVGGWPLMLAVVAIYCVVNVTLQVLVQPKFVSDAVSLSLTLSFFSVIFWTFIIGPLGAIVSIPLTLLVRALVLEGDPGARWLRWLSGDVVTATPDRRDGTG